MTNFDRLDEKMRFQPFSDSQLGQTILYMRHRGYDLSQEAEDLLIARFLPFALREQSETPADLQAATHIACNCIGKLSGIIQAMREAYQLQPLTPKVIPNDNASISQISGSNEDDGKDELEPEPKEPRNHIEDSFHRMFGE